MMAVGECVLLLSAELYKLSNFPTLGDSDRCHYAALSASPRAGLWIIGVAT
jgi:hypothetical protein